MKATQKSEVKERYDRTRLKGRRKGDTNCACKGLFKKISIFFVIVRLKVYLQAYGNTKLRREEEMCLSKHLGSTLFRASFTYWRFVKISLCDIRNAPSIMFLAPEL